MICCVENNIEAHGMFAKDIGLEKHSRKVPSESAIRRVDAYFDKTGSGNIQAPPWCPRLPKISKIEGNVQLFEQTTNKRWILYSLKYFSDHKELACIYREQISIFMHTNLNLLVHSQTITSYSVSSSVTGCS